MTLVNRVSAFFLAALAIILASFAGVVYALVSFHLHQQFDQQLHSALNTLAAAVEVERDEVRFQRSDHAIGLGVNDGLKEVRWVVADASGKLVDHSRNLVVSTPENAALIALAGRPFQTVEGAPVEDGSWRYLRKRLYAVAPKPPSELAANAHDAVIVTVAQSPSDLHSDLRWLATLLVGLPLVSWLAAAAGGQWFCMQALAPVKAMAAQANAIECADFRFRLPTAGAEDELADLSRAFNQVLDRLQQAFERQQRFTGAAAHQLRNPLTVLAGQIDVALRRPRPAEEHAQTLNLLRGQTNELRQIVEALLFLARSEPGTAPPDARPVMLKDWLPEYMERWRLHARSEDVSFQVDPTASIVASPPLLSQFLDNLVSNALKYSAAGTPIRVEATSAWDGVRLQVVDQGVGIEPEDQAAIFEPFFRSKKARQSGAAGTGLGLALASRIAEVCGGSLQCESAPGRGSRFHTLLPHAAVKPAGNRSGLRTATPCATTFPSSPPTPVPAPGPPNSGQTGSA